MNNLIRGLYTILVHVVATKSLSSGFVAEHPEVTLAPHSVRCSAGGRRDNPPRPGFLENRQAAPPVHVAVRQSPRSLTDRSPAQAELNTPGIRIWRIDLCWIDVQRV